jgi:hypothetical protein
MYGIMFPLESSMLKDNILHALKLTLNNRVIKLRPEANLTKLFTPKGAVKKVSAEN